MFTLLYALITFCAVAIVFGMVLLAITLIRPLSFITTRKCGEIILLGLMGMILCVTITMMLAGAG
ncbi:MAG: hypothetical protein J6D46_05390 [Lachnospiraceae bacterium]|jgi:hypothetical protein|nr:hypothetical protein [Lachnospiraceae bacterium]